MKKLLVFVVCFVLTITSLASDDNQSNALEPILSSNASQPVSQILEKLDANERENAIIEIECDAEAESQANLIEAEWNSGNYDEAIELLKDSPELENAAIGIQWKEPIIGPSLRWGDDVQIGTRDSVKTVCLDVDNSTGNLFVVLLYQEGSIYRYTMNMSQDTGKTWTETYVWNGFIPYQIDIDGVVCGNYFYLAYTYAASSTLGRIRRFNTSDGSADEEYGFLTVIDEGVSIRDIALASAVDNPGASFSYYLFYFAIMDNDSLKVYWSNTIATAWYVTVDPDGGIADRGLGACSQAATTTFNNMWASFIGTDNCLYVAEVWGSCSHHGPLDYVGISTLATTSIAAYEDTIMVIYPHYNGTLYEARYSVSYNEGDSWTYGIIDDSTGEIMGLANDITGRNGDGFGVAYQNFGNAASGFYRHRTYAYVEAGFTPRLDFADQVPYSLTRPSIERIASGTYGIVYIASPQEIALFDRSDWISGIPEDSVNSNGEIECSIDKNIITGTATLKYTLPGETNVDISIANILGQTVATLDNGLKESSEHTISVSAENLSQGIYFIVVKTENGLTGTVKFAVLK
jgi:hypothetical protein